MTTQQRTWIPVVLVDNRDPRCTWLWISDHEYVEVDPVDLVENMVENCTPWYEEEAGIDPTELQRAVDVFKADDRKRYCPKCREPMDGPILVSKVPGTIGDEVVHTYDIHYQCMTCPDIFQVVISTPGV